MLQRRIKWFYFTVRITFKLNINKSLFISLNFNQRLERLPLERRCKCVKWEWQYVSASVFRVQLWVSVVKERLFSISYFYYLSKRLSFHYPHNIPTQKFGLIQQQNPTILLFVINKLVFIFPTIQRHDFTIAGWCPIYTQNLHKRISS